MSDTCGTRSTRDARAAPVLSPCTGVCRIDAQAGWCEGCRRTLDEIAAWSTLDDTARQRLCDALPRRRLTPAPKPPLAKP